MSVKRARTSQTNALDASELVNDVAVLASRSVSSNKDLMYHVFLWLDNADLASAIRVSKAFFSPAARRLWFGLRGLGVGSLLALLPFEVQYFSSDRPESLRKLGRPIMKSDLPWEVQYHYSRDRSPETLRTPSRAIMRSDLDRWLVYAEYVQAISLPGEFVPSEPHLRTLQGLVSCVPRDVLFPNLKTLTVVYSPLRLEFSKPLLTRSLRNVNVQGAESESPVPSPYFSPDPMNLLTKRIAPIVPFDLPNSATHSIIAFLDFLPAYASSLTNLTIVGLFGSYRSGPRLAPALAACLKALRGIEWLSLDNIARSNPVLSAIIRLKNLRLLRIQPTTDVKTYPYDDMESSSSSTEGFWEARMRKIATQDMFCHLATLDLSVDYSPDFLIGLLHHLQPPLLQLVMHVRFAKQDKASSLLATVVTCCPSLLSLSFVVRGSLPSDLWTCLCRLRDLNLDEFGLIINVRGDIFPLNDHLLNVAKMHPRLKKFTFDVIEKASGAVQEPTLAGLLSLAEICPDLTDLRVGALFPTSGIRIVAPIKKPALERLFVRDSRMDPIVLAEFVGALWPNASVLGVKESEEINKSLGIVRRLRGVDAGEQSLFV